MKSFKFAFSLAAVGFLATGTPVSADSRQVSCSKNSGGTNYTATHWINYHSANSLFWIIDTTDYQYGPSNSASVKNNQNLRLERVTPNAHLNSYYSADSLIRDNTKRNGMDLTTYAQTVPKSNTVARFTAIFDIPGSDPSCTAQTTTF